MFNGERLRQIRTERGWSQERLGEVIGVSRSAISKIEKGTVPDPKLEQVAKMAEALGVSAEWLSGWTDDRRPAGSGWRGVRRWCILLQNDFTNRYGDTARPFSELVGVFQNESDARKVQEDLINENAHDVLTYDCDEENIILEEMELQ